MKNLVELVESVEARYPRVIYAEPGTGSRAEAAADFVRSKAVKFMGYQGGADYWQVGEFVTSIDAGTCTCNDYGAPKDDGGGKLCKHRIAARFQQMISRTNGVDAVLKCVSPHLNRIALAVDVLYTDTGRQYTLSGYRFLGWVHYEYDERVTFTEVEFNAALRVNGWTMREKPSKQKGFLYFYFLERGVGGEEGINSLTGQDAELRTQRNVMRQLQTVDEMMREEIAR